MSARLPPRRRDAPSHASYACCVTCRLVPEVLSVCSVQYKCVTDAQRRKAALPGRGLEYVDARGVKHPAVQGFTFVAADGVEMPLEVSGLGLGASAERGPTPPPCAARLPQEGASVFITMNPGYIGRAELPESLKARAARCTAGRRIHGQSEPLCRPAGWHLGPAGAVPAHHRGGARPPADHGEHADGGGLHQGCATRPPPARVLARAQHLKHIARPLFRPPAAKALAKKFAALYYLLEDLLSPQKHYDWGLRAIKSVLVVAGGLLRSQAGQDETDVLFRALR